MIHVKRILRTEILPGSLRLLLAILFLALGLYGARYAYSSHLAMKKEIQLYTQFVQSSTDSSSLKTLQEQLYRLRRIREQSGRAELTADFLDSMEARSNACEVNISSIDFNDPAQKGNIKTWSWNLVYEATYKKHHCLTEKLENMDVAVRIDELRMRTSEKQQAMAKEPELQINMSVHVLLPAEDAP